MPSRSGSAPSSTAAASSPARGRWESSTRASSRSGCSRTISVEPLHYLGLGGSGKQVRDLLHVDDLVGLVDLQLVESEHWRGIVANVGGGLGCSISLLELTALCREITGRTVPVHASTDERPNDIPAYISDCSRLHSLTDWRASADRTAILTDTYKWIVANERALENALGVDEEKPSHRQS